MRECPTANMDYRASSPASPYLSLSIASLSWFTSYVSTRGIRRKAKKKKKKMNVIGILSWFLANTTGKKKKKRKKRIQFLPALRVDNQPVYITYEYLCFCWCSLCLQRVFPTLAVKTTKNKHIKLNVL